MTQKKPNSRRNLDLALEREYGRGEELINSYRTEGGWSIFLTGSNSYLLSGQLVTKLTGRYLEFEVFTRS